MQKIFISMLRIFSEDEITSLDEKLRSTNYYPDAYRRLLA